MTLDKKIPKDACTNKHFFIEKMGELDIHEDYVDLSLTCSGLRSELGKKVRKAVSPQRYITIEDCVLWPGHGEGKAKLGNKELSVRYAWQGIRAADFGGEGRNKWKVLNWTVRAEPFEGDNSFKNDVTAYMEEMYYAEGGKDEYKVKKKNWYKAMGAKPATLAGYRKSLQDLAKHYHEHMRDEDIASGKDEEYMKMEDELWSPEGIEKKIDNIRNKKFIIVPAIFKSISEVRLYGDILSESRNAKE